jgi:hypothetical protein
LLRKSYILIADNHLIRHQMQCIHRRVISPPRHLHPRRVPSPGPNDGAGARAGVGAVVATCPG